VAHVRQSGLGFQVKVNKTVEVVPSSLGSGHQSRDSIRNVQRLRGGLVFKAHRLVYYSTLGLRVMKKKRDSIRIENKAVPVSFSRVGNHMVEYDPFIKSHLVSRNGL